MAMGLRLTRFFPRIERASALLRIASVGGDLARRSRSSHRGRCWRRNQFNHLAVGLLSTPPSSERSLRQYRAKLANDCDDREHNSSGDHSTFDDCRCFFDKSPKLREHEQL